MTANVKAVIKTAPPIKPRRPNGQAKIPVRHFADRKRKMAMIRPANPPASVHILAIGLSAILTSCLKSFSSYVYVKPLNDIIPNTMIVIEAAK